MMIGFNIQAGEIPPTTHVDPAIPPAPQLVEPTSPQARIVNHEARTADTIYVTEVPAFTQVTTKTLAVPAGWAMKEIKHPPLYNCTEYPQPSTWEMVQIVQPVYIQPAPTVGEGNIDSITIITEGE